MGSERHNPTKVTARWVDSDNSWTRQFFVTQNPQYERFSLHSLAENFTKLSVRSQKRVRIQDLASQRFLRLNLIGHGSFEKTVCVRTAAFQFACKTVAVIFFDSGTKLIPQLNRYGGKCSTSFIWLYAIRTFLSSEKRDANKHS